MMARERAQRVATRVVPWVGPLPAPGDWVRTTMTGVPWAIESVAPMSGGDLALRLRYHPGPAPAGVTVHPYSRCATLDPLGPPRPRQVAAGGANATMGARWADPDDDRPSARRKARQVSGHRVMDVLRIAQARGAGWATEERIAAADIFRAEVEVASLGLTGVRDLHLITRAMGPSSGPAAVSLAQIEAAASVRRVMDRLNRRQTRIIEAVLFQNFTLPRWCAARDPKRRLDRETDLLVAALDHIVESYAEQVDDLITQESPVTVA
jgi:hypothetical protein